MSKDQFFQHPDTRKPAYLVFELNLSQLHELNGRVFFLPHQAGWMSDQQSWEIFVQRCRSGIMHHFDFVYGSVGGNHPTVPNKIRFSKNKDQLSLNSHRAVRCLSNVTVVTFRSEKKKQLKKNVVKQIITHLRSHVNTEHMFLHEVRNQLMKIGNLTGPQADQILKKSRFTFEMNEFDSMIMHEPASYWAFSLLYGNHQLWYRDYESYMIRNNGIV